MWKRMEDEEGRYKNNTSPNEKKTNNNKLRPANKKSLCVNFPQYINISQCIHKLSRRKTL